MGFILEAALLLVLLACSAFFSAAEVAFLSLSSIRLHSLVEKKARGAESLHRLKDNRRRVIISLLIGNTIVNITAASLATSISIAAFGEAGVGIAVGVMTFLILTFGEIIPKSTATNHGEEIILFAAPIVEGFYTLTSPLVFVFEQVNKLVPGAYSRATGIERFTEEDFRSAVKLGAHHQSISQKEKEMIENALAFKDRTVGEAMTPRSRVVALDGGMMVPEAHKKALQGSQYSRFPVMVDGRVVGTTSVKIIGRALYEHPDWHLSKVVWEAVRLKTTMKASDAFARMQEMGRNIAIVENEKKEFVGVVTLEDLLEEIVGEIK